MPAAKPSWDLPLRLFHWLLAVAVLMAYLTAEGLIGDMVWHGRIGLCILALVSFRIAWGWLGPPRARFAHFFPTPGKLTAELSGRWQGNGHSPLGALSVFALLLWLLAQIGTGLFSNDDFAFKGYLAGLVSSAQSGSVTGLHHRLFNLGLLLIGLHVAAIAYYLAVRRRNLLSPMLRGGLASGAATEQQPEKWSAGRFAVAAAFAVMVVAAVLATEIVVRSMQPPPVKHEVLF